MSNSAKSSPTKSDATPSLQKVVIDAVPLTTIPSIGPTMRRKSVAKKEKSSRTSINPSSPSSSIKKTKKKSKKSRTESRRSYTMSELHVDPLPSKDVPTPVVDTTEDDVDTSGKNTLNQNSDVPNSVENLGLKDPAMSEKLGKAVPNPPTVVDANISTSTETNEAVADESLQKTAPETHVAPNVATHGAAPNVVPDVTTSLAQENLVDYSESDESPPPKATDKETVPAKAVNDNPEVILVNETTASDKAVPTNSEASVARRTRSRVNKGVETASTPVQTPKPSKAEKATGKKPVYGPPKPVSKVVPRSETKERKAPPTSDSDFEPETDVVASDNVSFHLENGSARWKLVYHRRLALERNLKDDILECPPVVEALEYAGLLKTVVGLDKCYDRLVKEFLINVAADCNDPASPEYRQVFVRGKCVQFSPIVINQYLQRSSDEVAPLKATDNEICKVLTGGKIKVWPSKAKLSATSLSPFYAVLNRIAAHNWVPTTHSGDIARGLESLKIIEEQKAIIINLEADKVKQLTEIAHLNEEVTELNSHLENLKKHVLRLFKGSDLDEILETLPTPSKAKTGIGYEYKNVNRIMDYNKEGKYMPEISKQPSPKMHDRMSPHLTPRQQRQVLPHVAPHQQRWQRPRFIPRHRSSEIPQESDPSITKTRMEWKQKDDTTNIKKYTVESSGKSLIAHTSLRASSKEDWYFDSGCSRHMTGVEKYLKEVKSYATSFVTFGDGAKGEIKGIGRLIDHGLPKLESVLLVKGLTANLINISQLCDQGMKVNFTKNECLVSNNGGDILMRGVRSKDNCYLWIPLEEANVSTCLLTKNEEVKLWHQKLGHLNLKSMKRVISEEAIRGLPSLQIQEGNICGECQIGKQTKVSHQKLQHLSTSRVLELLHMDLMGPIQVESLGGKKYVLVVVDDFSRYTWVNFIREKSETFEEFKNLCLQLQKEKDCGIVRIRSDHGKEFENSKFVDFCAAEGINHEFSSPITPQQNGVVERKNRTLQESARVMLHAKNVPYKLWAEAMNTACYIHNRVTLRKGTATTLYELWKNRKPTVKYFHVFGSKCYIFADREPRRKLDPKSDEGIFLGYSTNSRAYRVFNSRTRTMMESINVVVDDSDTTSADPAEETDVITPVPALDDDQTEPEPDQHSESTTEAPRPNKGPSTRTQKNHPLELVIGNPNQGIATRRSKEAISNSCFISKIEPKNVKEALTDEYWINAMQEELTQFKRSEVWDLVPRPDGINVIGTNHGYKKGGNDKTLFVREEKGKLMIAQIYVDDIVFGGMSRQMVEHFVHQMQSEFEMSLVGELTYFLDLQVKQMEDTIFISQEKYARNIVKKFGMEVGSHKRTPAHLKLTKDEKGIDVDQSLYRSMIGSLLYLTASIPDIMFAVGVCARYQSEPKMSHLTQVKRIFKYVNGTCGYGILYSHGNDSTLVGYCDADWAGSADDRKNTSGACFFLGSNLVSWFSKKQNSVSLSAAEAEYIAAGSSCSQLLWMRQMLKEYSVEQDVMTLYCDNLSAINISKNPIQHSRTKHIDIRHHFIRELVEEKIVTLEHIASEE
ncbi:unnamed protein product [Trifolium pratense]|uniref:Uncharacterized protein n=1 Tax=Trifolium pratense TaxID=57577 RepID=A0ACB0KX76_TRIPR|nr:unnamed protein product [Trifolium pratense]